MPAVLNAANEVAVQGFLDDRIGFLDIEKVILGTMDAHEVVKLETLDDTLAADCWARSKAENIVDSLNSISLFEKRAGNA